MNNEEERMNTQAGKGMAICYSFMPQQALGGTYTPPAPSELAAAHHPNGRRSIPLALSLHTSLA